MKPVALLFLLLVVGCGSNSEAKSPSSGGGSTPTPSGTSTSMWTGNYAGTLEFKGCPSIGSCSGDVVTLGITQTPNAAALAIQDTDTTLKQTLQWTGIAIYTGTAPEGPGTQQTTATVTTSTGQTIFIDGTGSSSTSDPVLMQSLAVYNYPVKNGVGSKGAYLGTLTRTN